MIRKKLGLWAPILVLASAITVFALTTGDVEAGGRGKGGGKPAPAPTATLTVSPNPVPAWGTMYQVSGTGFTPNLAVNFVRGGLVSWAVADASGYAVTSFQSWDPGTYTIEAYQPSGKSWVRVGSVTFQVV